MTTNTYDVYMESKQRLDAGKGDARDEVLVGLWAESKKLTLERNELKRASNFATKRIAQLDYHNNILESRLHILTEGRITLGFEEVSEPTAH